MASFVVRLEKYLDILQNCKDPGQPEVDVLELQKAIILKYQAEKLDTNGKTCSSCKRYLPFKCFYFENRQKDPFLEPTNEKDYAKSCLPCRMAKTIRQRCGMCNGLFAQDTSHFGRYLTPEQQILHPDVPYDDDMAVTGPGGQKAPKVHAKCCPKNDKWTVKLPFLQKAQLIMNQIKRIWTTATPMARLQVIGVPAAKRLAIQLKPQQVQEINDDLFWNAIQLLTTLLQPRPIILILRFTLPAYQPFHVQPTTKKRKHS
jgi:hypothetical protein